jgi:hypothetical protein
MKDFPYFFGLPLLSKQKIPYQRSYAVEINNLDVLGQ